MLTSLFNRELNGSSSFKYADCLLSLQPWEGRFAYRD